MSRPGVLVGRGAELTRLSGWLRALATGRGQAVLVEGEPGIGKSMLVRAACANAGFPVHWGSGDELGQDLPLMPLLDGLRVHGDGLAGAANARRQTIARLMRGEETIGHGVDVATAMAEHLLALLEELCADGPVVLVVDDLHWADRHTVALCGRLARLVQQIPLLFIGITRPVPRRTELVSLRRSIPVADRIRLSRLADAEIETLLTELAGGAPSERLRRLAAGAAGNPLYLTELVGSLSRGGRLFTTESGLVETTVERTPRSLSAAIAERLGFLPPQVLDVLRLAALLGTDFSVGDLAVVSGQGTGQLVPAIEDARASGILTEVDDSLAFRHPLIRIALYEQLPRSVRAAWHRDAAKALIHAGAPADRVARQLVPADATNEEWVVQWLDKAAPALVGHAPKVAAELLRRTNTRPELLADALYRMGEPAQAAVVADRALADDPEPGRLVELYRILTQCRFHAGQPAAALAALRSALTMPGLPAVHRARLLVLAARANRDLGRVDEAEALAREALEQTTDRWATGWALHVLVLVSMMRGASDEALALLERALTVASDDPDLTDLALLVRINQAVTLGDLDRYDEAIDVAGRMRQEAERTGSLVRLTQAHSAMGQLLLETGGWDDAVAEVDALPAEVKDPSVVCCDHGIAATICLHRDDPDSARRHLAAAAPSAEHVGLRAVAQLCLARSLDAEYAGDPATALAELVDGLADKTEIEDMLPDAVRLAVQVGELDVARTATARVHALVQSSPRWHAAALYCSGLVDDNPEMLLAAAGESNRRLPKAKAFEAAATAFVAAGDLSSARAAFARATAVYEELGATWDIARLASVQRAAGIRRAPRVAHKKATHGWESLTPTESKIAALVVEGLTNRQIAARLFLSPRTVGTHVSHILNKLGVNSRTDIAREAGRRASG
ncbi:helix-turn-helix transcriptional regulator [Kibdelosporangium phytohabitans]|uniref:LuxR family transcriptional regulator n=1 Tax=Kibdelosporangium phytohabitans TaxID=860235 RepID=A0A0N9I1E4_9PSEU|nr:LuxR family transcriptional regulator [Kibdelosporangium phytohabitans]ALG08025.1 LuxR family transcriptional regulator [Kibdelosporangium phytohabitans]MBE1471015.1 ATP/maltotriose-dependent transcriptional regulator MalT [Kibdelosporangium phytohabitans]